MFARSAAMVILAALMITAGKHLNWTCIFPAVAMAGSIYGYVYVR